jgi:acetolactate synthase-1/2/3 large subunit
MPEMTGAQYIAAMLQAYGITHVFYVEAILRRTLVEMEKLGIKRILTHSEKAAAYMADGFARAGLRPGVCMAQSVGAANLAAGLQDARLGHAPILAFTGRKPPMFQYRNAYQEILHNTMFEAVTKYNVEVHTLEQVPHLLAQAFREATTGTPAPVHLDFLGYEGNFTDEAKSDLSVLCESEYTRVPAKRPCPNPGEIEAAAQSLRKAERPVLVVGRGAVVSGAGEEVRKLAESMSIPVAFSMDGKGLIPDDHPLSVGAVGTYCRPCANRTVAEADLVFFIGCGTGDQVTKNWTLPPVGTPVIQLDINAAEIGRNYPGALGILGDARVSLEQLNKAISSPVKKESWSRTVQGYVQAYLEKIGSLCSSNAAPIRAECLCRRITEALPDNAVVVADTGYSAIWAGTLIDITGPQQMFLRASGSLGWAFPASLGAKCALPDRPVFCFSGDGAFWYHLCELETAVRRNIPTVTIINNNSVLGQSQLGIRRAYRDDRGEEQEQYRFQDTNFARLAEDLGAVGIRVEKPEEIAPAIRRAIAENRPAVVDVVTEAESHPLLTL